MPALHILQLLAPGAVDPVWEAEKAGWRCYVMQNTHSCYRRGSRLRAAWQRGFDAAAASPDPARAML